MDTLSGNIGVLLIPDQLTISRVGDLTKNYGSKWEYAVGGKYIPHLTLYFGHLREVPVSKSRELISRLRHSLQGLELELSDLEIFGRNYLFWNSNNPGDLQVGHNDSLALATYLDPQKKPTATGLDLSARQKNNMTRYGHPLVGDDYKPHITLGFSSGLDAHSLLKSIQHTMNVEDVVIARMGQYGRVDEVIRDI